MLPNFEFKTIQANGGTIAYEVAGSGSLILCLPGMGDLRQEYDRLAPELVKAGFRVMVADLRGHGDSSIGWSRYDVPALASDIAPLLDAEGAHSALLIGCSISGASTAYFAAQHPDRVTGLIGFGAVRREPFTGIKAILMPLLLQVLFVNLWGVSVWGRYYRALYPATPPQDIDEYIARMTANLREPGRFAALKALLFSGRDSAHLQHVQCPVLDFIGTGDPDFDDPQAEAAWLRSIMLQDEVHLLPGLGHYVHRESPQSVLPRVLSFAQTVFERSQQAESCSTDAFNG